MRYADYKGKNVLVLGLAKSGVSAALLLEKLGARVLVNDVKPLSESEEAEKLLERKIRVIGGTHPVSLFDEEDFDLVVKNPGIPYRNPMVRRAQELGIPVITEVELAYQISEGEFIGITGTNGKTTTTTLIYEMLKEGGLSPLIAGNIGLVSCEVAQEARRDQPIVTELSSFQLAGIDRFRPKIAVITNIYDAHADFHETRENYVSAKKNITKNQLESDFLIVNDSVPECREIAESSRANVIPFSAEKFLEEGASVKDGFICFRGERVAAVKDVALPGRHNLENVLAGVAACKLLNVPNESIAKVLKTFRGVKHRLQFVKNVNGRLFYNDSKATNILATKTALSSFDRPVILLAGGLDRGYDLSPLIPSLKNVKALISFGQTKHQLREIGEKAGIEKLAVVDNVEEAVKKAYDFSESGDVILLSPACASWDQYKSFEERGDIFIEAVHRLE